MNHETTTHGEGMAGHWDTLEELCQGIRKAAYEFMHEAEQGIESGRFDLIEEHDAQNVRAAIQCLAEVYDMLAPAAPDCPACMQDTRPNGSNP